MFIPSDGVEGDSGGESGHGVQAGRDTETKCRSRLEPGVPIHHHCPDPPRLTLIIYQFVFHALDIYIAILCPIVIDLFLFGGNFLGKGTGCFVLNSVPICVI